MGEKQAAVAKWRWFSTALLAAVLFLGLTLQIDQRAAKPVDEAFERALVTFAVVRGINAVVSVVQGTELAIEPAGIGVILTPGEVFDPVNDLIERFSWIMLAASTSLGAQKVLIAMGITVFFQSLLIVAVVWLAVVIWKPHWFTPHIKQIITRAALLLLFVRFAAPLVALANDAVYETFLAERYQSSYSALEQTRDEVEALHAAEKSPASNKKRGDIFDRIGQWYDRTSKQFDVDARIEQYKAQFSRASEHIIHLIVVFMLQTVIFPILFLWVGLRLIRSVVRGDR